MGGKARASHLQRHQTQNLLVLGFASGLILKYAS